MLIHFMTLILVFRIRRTSIFWPFVYFIYAPELCEIVNTISLYDLECKWGAFETSGHYLAGWPTSLLFGHVVLLRKINSLCTQMLGYSGI
ncbi:hypothetical protein DFH07DRAFT_850246 [Mycena maculata]|uniref:Uncharacterized protein n=1 Tax=Mycena maculata TaxID=230809 RepID=A0AAD7MS00_9AGAR|nr:hypothetical protein DFH07DRAFT_850246 [Mycena maculata]